MFDRFLIDTFDDITGKISLTALIKDITSQRPNVDVFKSGTLINRLLTHCKRLLKNWDAMEEGLLEDSLYINKDLVMSVVRKSLTPIETIQSNEDDILRKL